MQISCIQNIPLHFILAMLIACSSVISFTNMLLYPLTKFQKFLVFSYSFLIAVIYGFSLKPFSFIITLFMILLGTLLLITVFQKHRIVNLLCSVFNFYIAIGTNYLLILFFSHFKIDEFFFKEFPYMFCLYLIVQLICTYFVSYLLLKLASHLYFKTNITDLKISYAGQIFILLFCEISIYGFILFLQTTYDINLSASEVIQYNIFIFLLLFVTVNSITILFFKNILKEQQFENQVTQANAVEKYAGHLEDLYLNIRSFKHDYINILSSLHAYINDHDYKGLEEYFYQEILPAGSKIASQDSIYGRLGHIQAPEIKSILYLKIFLALKQEINVTTQIKDSIDNFPMNTIDLVRILGILLDNAIEASAATAEKILSIIFLKDSEGIYIQIQNSSCNIDNIEKIYQIGTSSKGSERGIGLYEARQILKKHPNALLNTEYSNFMFSQKLVLLYL